MVTFSTVLPFLHQGLRVTTGTEKQVVFIVYPKWTGSYPTGVCSEGHLSDFPALAVHLPTEKSSLLHVPPPGL